MNNETNNEMVLRYSCAIGAIGWNRLSTKREWPAYFQLIRMRHREAFPSAYLTGIQMRRK
ncbi:MAG: hypothetical protein KatS3mg110_0462 [Pirellulaceae bacterium]|nr:MAG: hypothetical protein KatS3mg015_3196 [Fimbriimonadales bacterium]GIW92421.1 MAG: hypothetical protein KatS3mg110_0462 [Pirellulaceae bacterium]